MATTIADKYYLKVVEGYPYDLEESMENLHYALSYNHEHVGALHLMACFYMEQLDDFEKAEEFLLEALSADPKSVKVGMTYAHLNICMKQYDKAKKILNYLATLSYVDKATLMEMGAFSLECQKRFEEAILLLERARLETYNNSFMNVLDESIKRIKLKKKRLKKLKKK